MASKVLEKPTENDLVVGIVGGVEADGFINDKVIEHFGTFVGMLEFVLKTCFLGLVDPFTEPNTAGSFGSWNVVVGVVM